MSKQWTKSEEAVLTDYMGGRRVLCRRDKLAIHRLLPNRSPAAIEKRWGIMMGRKKPERQGDSISPEMIKDFLRPYKVPLPQYNLVDVAFTRPITKTDIIRHYRDQGLRGRVTIEWR